MSESVSSEAASETYRRNGKMAPVSIPRKWLRLKTSRWLCFSCEQWNAWLWIVQVHQLFCAHLNTCAFGVCAIGSPQHCVLCCNVRWLWILCPPRMWPYVWPVGSASGSWTSPVDSHCRCATPLRHHDPANSVMACCDVVWCVVV
jgi:hypothetical protein